MLSVEYTDSNEFHESANTSCLFYNVKINMQMIGLLQSYDRF